MTVEIWLVRHGESASNAQGIWQGQGNSPLSDRGRSQVDALRARLSTQRFDLAVTSDLSRAADTSMALAPSVERDPQWREIDVGEWEGLTMPEVVQRFPEQIEALKAREPFRVGGAESWPELYTRADSALASVRERLQPGQRAIVFSHGAVIAAIMAGLAGARDRWPWPLGRMRNTAISIVRFDDHETEVFGHNDDRHLPNDLASGGDVRADQSLLRLRVPEDTKDAVDAEDVRAAIKAASPSAAAHLPVGADTLAEVGEELLAGRTGIVRGRNAEPSTIADAVSAAAGVTAAAGNGSSQLRLAHPSPGTELDILVSHQAAVMLSLRAHTAS